MSCFSHWGLTDCDVMFQPVGCDGALESDLEFDECRVCDGDGSSCHIKKGTVATDKLILGRSNTASHQMCVLYVRIIRCSL